MTTRYERLAARSRRLEVVAAVAAVTFTCVTCRFIPAHAAEVAPRSPGSGDAARPASGGVRTEQPPSARPQPAPVRVTVPGAGGVEAAVPASPRAGGALPEASGRPPTRVVWDAAGPAQGEAGRAV